MNFEDKKIWKDSVELSTKIYKIFDTVSPKYYSITDHAKKSVVSTASNIAEGFERDNKKELKYFLRVAKGSFGELFTQLNIIKELNFTKRPELDGIFDDIGELAK